MDDVGVLFLRPVVVGATGLNDGREGSSSDETSPPAEPESAGMSCKHFRAIEFQNEAPAQFKLTVPLRRWLICWLGHQISPWGYALSTALANSNGRSPLCTDGRRQCLLEDDTSFIDTFNLFIYYIPSQLSCWRYQRQIRFYQICIAIRYMTPTPDGGGRRINSLNILNLIGFNV